MSDRTALLERLRLIVQKISGRHDLDVTTDTRGAPPEREHEWFTVAETDPRDPDKVLRTWVHIPAAILEASEDVAKGKAAHEAGHVAITRHGSFIPDEVLQQPGFHGLASSVEERPTDRVVTERYPGAGAWLREARQDSIRQGSEAMATLAPRSIPAFFELCDLIVYRPYLESLLRYSTTATNAYSTIEEPLLRLERTLPAEGANEQAVREAAVARYRILYEEIWPEARRLLDEDLRAEMLRRLSSEREGRGAPSPASDVEASGRLGRLTVGQREALAVEAEEAMREREDAIARERDGGFDPLRPETHAEFAARRERETEERRIEENLAEIGRAQASMVPAGPYERAYQEIRHLDEELHQRLEEVFRPVRAGTTRRVSAGPRVDLGAVFRREAARAAGAPGLNDRIFETRSLPQKRDWTITLLVDLSGSMSTDGKIDETFKAVVLFTEVLSRLGIRHEILGFQDELIVFKSPEEELDGTIRQRVSGMLAEVTGTNPGGHNVPAFNDDGPCLLAASAGLEKEPGAQKLLLVLSDGLPAGCRSGNAELHAAVRSVLSGTGQVLIGLGLGEETSHVADFYPVALPGIRAEELPVRLSNLLADVLENPGRYRSTGT